MGPPASPWQMRKNTSVPSVGAKPQQKENTPNSAMALQNTVTVPNRRARKPVSGTVIASATE